eukprot:gene7462-biopygen4551
MQSDEAALAVAQREVQQQAPEERSKQQGACFGRFRHSRMQAARGSVAQGCMHLEIPPLVRFHRSWLQVAGGPPHADAGNWKFRSSWLPAAGGWFRDTTLPVAGGSAVRGCKQLEVPPHEEADNRRSLRPWIGRGDRPAKAGRPPTHIFFASVRRLRHIHFPQCAVPAAHPFPPLRGACGTSISPSARCLRHIHFPQCAVPAAHPFPPVRGACGTSMPNPAFTCVATAMVNRCQIQNMWFSPLDYCRTQL